MSTKPALMFLSRWFPYPPHNGSRIRIYNLLKVLRQRYRITLITFAEEEVCPEHLAVVRALCAQVEVFPYRPFQPNNMRARLGFLAPRPRFLVDTYQPALARKVQTLLTQHNYRLVVASELDMLPYLEGIRDVPRVVEELEISTPYEAYHYGQGRQRWRRALTWWKLNAYLRRVLPTLEGCTTVSEIEKQRLQQAVPNAPVIETIPNGVDNASYQGDFGPPEPDTLIYNGALTYEANFDAVAYFLKTIFPLLLEQHPQVTLKVTGKTAGVSIASLPLHRRVILTGYVDDIRPAVARSWATVIPLRRGGGTRLKILESLALGTPVVSTSKGAEGLNLRDGEHLLIADTPRDFAAAIQRLLKDPALRQYLSAQGREHVRQTYDWSQIGVQLLNYLQKVETNGARHSS